MSDPELAVILTVHLILLMPIPMGYLELIYHPINNKGGKCFPLERKSLFSALFFESNTEQILPSV